MNLQIVGCSHHRSSVEVRERLAFSESQIRRFLADFYERYPQSEAVLLSTCNRTEFYVAGNAMETSPSQEEMVKLLAENRDCPVSEVQSDLFRLNDDDAIRHLFTVAASLDSMVVGEAQILSQVKQAYRLAIEANPSIPVTHQVFQAAIRVARRIANETEIHSNRVSIPSVAIGLFARQVFERLDNKRCLILGAGEMAEETIHYLEAFGAEDIAVCNRTRSRAEELALRFDGETVDWADLAQELKNADLVVSATAAVEPVLTLEKHGSLQKDRNQKPLFLLDLGIPRDIDPRLGEELNVYLFTIDDLQKECDRNREARLGEWPRAKKIIDQETSRFIREMEHRRGGATIAQLKEQADVVKAAEIKRLMNRLDGIDPDHAREIEYAFHRLVNKILHPPLEALKTESMREGSTGLLDALRRLFQLNE